MTYKILLTPTLHKFPSTKHETFRKSITLANIDIKPVYSIHEYILNDLNNNIQWFIKMYKFREHEKEYLVIQTSPKYYKTPARMLKPKFSLPFPRLTTRTYSLKFSDRQTISSQKMCDHINANTWYTKNFKTMDLEFIHNDTYTKISYIYTQLELTVYGTIFSWFGCCGFSPVWTKNLTAMINNCSLSSRYIPHLNRIMCKTWGWHWHFFFYVGCWNKKGFSIPFNFKKKNETNYQYCMAVPVLHHSQKRSQFAANSGSLNLRKGNNNKLKLMGFI